MKKDWVAQIGDRVEQHVLRTKGEGATIVCASGISPSGPIHLGNLREVMTVYLVSEELRSRGWKVDHIHSWDDFDRLRKIPAGVSADFAQYIGCPISDIPDPFGEYESYAVRYMTDFTRSLARLNIFPRFVRQSIAYRQGTYVAQIKEAFHRRLEIFDTLAEFQTLQGQDTLEERRASYYPFKVYCEQCHKDSTQITDYNEDTATITYTCQHCQHHGAFSLNEKVEGKLVWKVDWPMRWSYEQVDFEPGGEDHSSPGSSFTVGQKIVRTIFQFRPPQYAGYAFVGMDGRTKISSSVGTFATVSAALDIFEPALLRWLYVRKANNQAFNIDFGQGLLRVYDEWDGLLRQMHDQKANEVNKKIYERAVHTSQGDVTLTPRPAPFNLLTSVIDVTQENMEQVQRIVSQYLGEHQLIDREQLEPRLTCASTWVTQYEPDDERTHIRSSFDEQTYAQLPEPDRQSIQMLVDNLDDSWSLSGLTELMYRIPKVVRGYAPETPANDEIKQAQRSFFVALYTLICGKDTGPRIPTLLLSLGKEKVRSLLSSEMAISSK